MKAAPSTRAKKSAPRKVDVRAPRTRTATKRRTQEERREGTIRLLLDATCDELFEAGYAGATTARICARADVSQGALFRHFPTREALMVAAAEDIGAAMLASYEEAFRANVASSERPRPESETLVGGLRLLREHCATKKNQAFYELLMAGRTDARLREALRGPSVTYYAAIERLAVALVPNLAASLGPAFPLVVDTMLAVFDGEAVHGFVLPEQTARREGRIELLAGLVATLGASANPT